MRKDVAHVLSNRDLSKGANLLLSDQNISMGVAPGLVRTMDLLVALFSTTKALGLEILVLQLHQELLLLIEFSFGPLPGLARTIVLNLLNLVRDAASSRDIREVGARHERRGGRVEEVSHSARFGW